MADNMKLPEELEMPEDDQASEQTIVTPGQLVRRRFVRNKLAIIGVIILVIMVIFSFIGPIFSPYGEYEIFYRDEEIRYIYVLAGDQDLYALNIADGSLRWHLRTEEPIVSEPLISAETGRVFVQLESGVIQEFSANRGELANEYTDTELTSLVEVPFTVEVPENEELRYEVEFGFLNAYSLETGVKRWDFTGYSPVATEEPFYDETGNVYVVDEAGEVYAVRPERGVQRWSFQTNHEGPYLITEGPVIIRTLNARTPPSRAHLLGTDRMGLDVMTRLMYGGRISLMVGFVVIIIEILLGVILGGIAGYYGKWVDNLLMRIVDVFNCIPILPIMLIMGSVMVAMEIPSQSRIYVLMLALGLLFWPGVARIVRGQILSLREQEFMVAAESTGLKARSRIFFHLIPNVMPQLIVIATLGIGSVILLESALSYLGMGLSFPYASWGNMVDAVNDRRIMQDHLNIWVPPGIAILLTVMSFNFVGDGLRDAYDPKMRR